MLLRGECLRSRRACLRSRRVCLRSRRVLLLLGLTAAASSSSAAAAAESYRASSAKRRVGVGVRVTMGMVGVVYVGPVKADKNHFSDGCPCACGAPAPAGSSHPSSAAPQSHPKRSCRRCHRRHSHHSRRTRRRRSRRSHRRIFRVPGRSAVRTGFCYRGPSGPCKGCNAKRRHVRNRAGKAPECALLLAVVGEYRYGIMLKSKV